MGPEMITADASWRRIMVSRLDGTTMSIRDAGPITGPDPFRAALNCR